VLVGCAGRTSAGLPSEVLRGSVEAQLAMGGARARRWAERSRLARTSRVAGGRTTGARRGMVNGPRSVLIGLVFVPGLAMEIVVATLALELKLISQTVFVAIVFAALFSSVVAGPAMKAWAGRMGLLDEEAVA